MRGSRRAMRPTCAASRSASRTCSAPKACPARRPAAFSKGSAGIRIHRHAEPVRCGRGHAGQAQHGRIRHGLVQRDLGLWQCGEPLEAWKRRAADAGRLLGRLGRCRCGRSVPWRDRHRYRRLDPPACGLYRHHRDQADLRALFALGRCGLCLLARSGGADDQDGARRAIMLEAMCGHDPKDQHQRRPARAGFRGGADRRHPRQGDRDSARIPHGRHARRRSRSSGQTAPRC